MKQKETFVKEFYNNRKLIWTLAKNDFKTKYAGSYLGKIWAFIQPVVTTLVYWFVFQIGLRAGQDMEYPYILWLMAGLIPWFYFSESLNGGTAAMLDYSYLVKKVVFNIRILPLVKVISALFVHVFFVGILFVLAWAYGYHPDVYSLQLLYYMICSFLLVMGLSYLSSAVVCFFRDLSQVINILLQIGIWVTPIMWDAEKTLSAISPVLVTVFKLNPVYYIVQGFRNAVILKQWFWEDAWWTIYFWVFTIAMLWIGTAVFKRLKVHFADVL